MLNVLTSVHLDFFHAADFGDSEHSKEKEYEVYILFELSWSAVSIGTGAARAFWSFYRCIRIV